MKGEAVRPCARCRRPTRPARSHVGEYPGTTARYADLCKTCYHGGSTPPPPEPPQSIEEIRAGLVAYLRRRREREDMMARREMYLCHPNLARKQVRA